jgi:hypothetical protein
MSHSGHVLKVPYFSKTQHLSAKYVQTDYFVAMNVKPEIKRRAKDYHHFI